MDGNPRMSLLQCPALPANTAQAAEAVFGRDHPYLRIGESLETLCRDLDLSTLELFDGFLADTFFPCSLATIIQVWERLTDRQMSQATRTRLDVKYALHLPFNYPGIQPQTLCAFRHHILTSQAGSAALQEMADHLNDLCDLEKPISAGRIEALVCLPSRAEIILECMGTAMEAVATFDPNWLRAHAQAHWYERYHPSRDLQQLPGLPAGIRKLAEAVGKDGQYLLEAIQASGNPNLARLPEILSLRQEWQRQFESKAGSLKFREACCLTRPEDLLTTGSTSSFWEGGKNNHYF